MNTYNPGKSITILAYSHRNQVLYDNSSWHTSYLPTLVHLEYLQKIKIISYIHLKKKKKEVWLNILPFPNIKNMS